MGTADPIRIQGKRDMVINRTGYTEGNADRIAFQLRTGNRELPDRSAAGKAGGKGNIQVSEFMLPDQAWFDFDIAAHPGQ